MSIEYIKTVEVIGYFWWNRAHPIKGSTSSLNPQKYLFYPEATIESCVHLISLGQFWKTVTIDSKLSEL